MAHVCGAAVSEEVRRHKGPARCTQRAEEYTSDEIDAARELNHTQNPSVSVCKAKDRKTLTWKQ